MDPSTVVTLLALNLIAVGGLLKLIGLHMADPSGLNGFATGALSFGLAYLLRLALGFSSGTALGLVSDTLMIFAMLAFATGLQQFSGRSPIGRSRIVGLVLGFAAAASVATWLWQGVGRHAALNLALGGAYAAVAGLAWTGARRELPALRTPLRLLAALVGLLSLLTMLRGLAAMRYGVPPLFAGPWAQAYYGYSIAVTMMLGPNLLWMVFVRLNLRLSELATHDTLTGVLNRHGLDEALQRHFGTRPPQPLVLLLVDVDHFKRINDQHGHAAGDAVLRGVAQTLTAQLRGGDVVARWGGEEFLVCCSGAEAAQVQALAQRLRQSVEAASCAAPAGLALSCTVSVGVSQPFDQRSGWEAAARAADAALYRAKHEGRNRVVLAPERPAD